MMLLLVLALTLVAGLLFLLPLAPSLREISAKTDARAIKVSRLERMDTRHFAERFSALVRRSLGPTLDTVERTMRSATGELTPRDPVLVVPDGFGPASMNPRSTPRTFTRVMAGAGDLSLAEDVDYLREVFARGSLQVGARSRIRAGYSHRDLVLGPQSVVERWAHAERLLHVRAGSAVYGRGSAEDSILLEAPSGFLRLRAPSIECGAREFEDVWREPRVPLTEVDVDGLAHLVDHKAGRALLRGDLGLPASHVVTGALVVHGNLHVGAGARVRGSVKAHGKVTLDEGARIDGSLVARGDVTLATGCKVAGPVLTESDLSIGRRCKIGDVLRPTTVRAERIRAGVGTVVHGTLWATLKGEVVA